MRQAIRVHVINYDNFLTDVPVKPFVLSLNIYVTSISSASKVSFTCSRFAVDPNTSYSSCVNRSKIVDPNAFEVAKMSYVNIDQSLLNRALNEGFSGGEKKRNEIFQMAVLEPKLAILDETDSGLDIDALRIVAEGVNKLKSPVLLIFQLGQDWVHLVVSQQHYLKHLTHLKGIF